MDRIVAVTLLFLVSPISAFGGELYDPTVDEMASIERVVLSALPEHPLSKVAGLAAGKPYKYGENRNASWICGFAHDPANGSEMSKDNAFAGYLDLDSGEFFLAEISGSDESGRTNLVIACMAAMLDADPERLFE